MPVEDENYRYAKTYWSLPVDRRRFKDLIAQVKTKDKKAIKANAESIRRSVRDHERKGLVLHRVLQPEFSALDLARHHELEHRLKSKFDLSDAIVIDASPIKAQFKSKESHNSSYENILHKHLGDIAARLFTSLARPNDVFGIGGGRGPKYTVSSPFFRFRKGISTQVICLTGQVSTKKEHGQPGDWYDDQTDAGVIATRFAQKLEGSTYAELSDPFVGERSPAFTERLARVSLALVGVGVLTPPHPLFEFSDNPHLEGIEKQLSELVACLDCQASNIGDVCNHLFVFPTNETHTPTLNSSLVDEINSKTTSLRGVELSGICKRGSVVMVAGGTYKADAILHIARQKLVTHLVIDDETAQLVLNKHVCELKPNR